MNAWSCRGITLNWHSNQMHACKCLWHWAKLISLLLGADFHLFSTCPLSFLIFFFDVVPFILIFEKKETKKVSFFFSQAGYCTYTLPSFCSLDGCICNKCFWALLFKTSQSIKNYTVMCEALTKENNGVRDHWGAAESKTCKSKDMEMTGKL